MRLDEQNTKVKIVAHVFFFFGSIWRKNSGSGEDWSSLAIFYGFIYMRFHFPTH